MATNRKREKGNRLSLPVPEGTLSGDPLVIGALPCVAVVDRSAWTPDAASVQTDGTWILEVKGEGPGGNEAITLGEILYIDTDGELNTDETNGTRFGYALEPVDSGATAEIEVKVGY